MNTSDETPKSTSEHKELLPETQATYFSKILMLNRTEYYSRSDVLDGRIVNKEQIDEAIKKIYPDFDESILK